MAKAETEKVDAKDAEKKDEKAKDVATAAQDAEKKADKVQVEAAHVAKEDQDKSEKKATVAAESAVGANAHVWFLITWWVYRKKRPQRSKMRRPRRTR